MQALGHSLDMLRLSMAGTYIYHLRHLRRAAMYMLCVILVLFSHPLLIFLSWYTELLCLAT